MTRTSCALFAIVVLVMPGCRKESRPAAAVPVPAITIAANEPPDVPGGAEGADLRTAAQYAWQEFIAMNWPARPGVRDTPDPNGKFGQPGGPVVWETFRSKVEIYPGDGSAAKGPHGWDSGSPDFGYDQGPQYTYATDIPPCDGKAPAGTPAWVNLDEISQIGFDHMHAGVTGGQLIRYLAKANGVHYKYVVGNKYWYGYGLSTKNTPAATAAINFTTAVKNNAFPPESPTISFPPGTMEVKAAFRLLTPAEMSSGRFYTTMVRYYSQGQDAKPCYSEAVWGLLGLHIIHKTPTAPAYTWATFEQADNILTTAGGAVVPVEDDDGNVLRKEPPNTPSLSYVDGPYVQGKMPLVSKNGDFCSDPGARLFYDEIAVTDGQPRENTPSGGNICVAGRMRSIPSTVVDVNHEAHQAISAYEAENHLRPSPWHHYKLVNVQTFPFDKSQIEADDNSRHGAPSFYTSDIVVETDYTLQNHSGGPETHTGGAPSDLPINFVTLPQPPASDTYKNTYLLGDDRKLKARYNMGGCTGCHGLTQIVAGSDFSYILFESSVAKPEYPELLLRPLTLQHLGSLK